MMEQAGADQPDMFATQDVCVRDGQGICVQENEVVCVPSDSGVSLPLKERVRGSAAAGAFEVKLMRYTEQLQKFRADGARRPPRGGCVRQGTRHAQVAGIVVDGDGVRAGASGQIVQRAQDGLEAPRAALIGADTQEALNDSPRLDEDGVLGPDTWRTLQYLIIAWHREYLPAGWDYADWVDGEPGPATIGALQRTLNNSRTNSGRLW